MPAKWPRLLGPCSGYPQDMRRHIHRRVRVRKPGLDADADVNAVISVNVSGSRSERLEEDRSTHEDQPPDERADRSHSEDEGGEP
jgi:hypothetical protein